MFEVFKFNAARRALTREKRHQNDFAFKIRQRRRFKVFELAEFGA
jgi:hypothetical protein